mmetsp:Transcript_19512/g.30530  ORF Transcript_19512/g.30530 Transcript_19512/m.30530 type:complete len:255 (+) Transcript_19512:205-969(+)
MLPDLGGSLGLYLLSTYLARFIRLFWESVRFFDPSDFLFSMARRWPSFFCFIWSTASQNASLLFSGPRISRAAHSASSVTSLGMLCGIWGMAAKTISGISCMASKRAFFSTSALPSAHWSKAFSLFLEEICLNFEFMAFILGQTSSYSESRSTFNLVIASLNFSMRLSVNLSVWSRKRSSLSRDESSSEAAWYLSSLRIRSLASLHDRSASSTFSSKRALKSSEASSFLDLRTFLGSWGLDPSNFRFRSESRSL